MKKGERSMKVLFKTKQGLFLIIVAASLGYVIWNSPLTVDDLYYEAYGLKRIGDVFRFAIAYGNGRLFGNMLIHFMLRSPIVRTVLQTIGVLTLWLLTYETAEPTKTKSFYVCIALFVAISPTIFREDYLWSSAFANYIPGIIFMFLSFCLVRKSSEINRKKYIYI